MNNTVDAYFDPHWDSPFTFLRLSEYKFYMCGHISKPKFTARCKLIIYFAKNAQIALSSL